MKLEEYEQLQPHAQVDGMLFHTPNRHCAWRVETIYTKEPDTIQWLQKMKDGEVLYDVGANIGLYSIFAAKRGVKVFAFEPESQNFAVLQKNIALNKLTNCTAYPLCLSSVWAIDTLRLSSLIPGGSCHSFGADVDYRGAERKAGIVQGSIAITMDELCGRLGYPDHIKIDVDGFEHLVLNGGQSALHHVKSLLCEMDSNRQEHMEWHERLLARGFEVDQQQIATAMRKEGSFAGIGNRIYTRKA